MDKVTDVVRELIDGTLTWDEAEGMYPKFEQQESTSKQWCMMC